VGARLPRPSIPICFVLRLRDPYPAKHAAEGLQLTKPGASWNSPREAHRSATARARGCEFGDFLIHNDKVTTLRRTCRDSDHNRQQFGLGGDDPKRLTPVRRLRKNGVGIGRIARTSASGRAMFSALLRRRKRSDQELIVDPTTSTIQQQVHCMPPADAGCP